MRLDPIAVGALAGLTAVSIIGAYVLYVGRYEVDNYVTYTTKTGDLLTEYRIAYGRWARNGDELYKVLDPELTEALDGLSYRKRPRWTLLSATGTGASYAVELPSNAYGENPRIVRLQVSPAAKDDLESSTPFKKGARAP